MKDLSQPGGPSNPSFEYTDGLTLCGCTSGPRNCGVEDPLQPGSHEYAVLVKKFIQSFQCPSRDERYVKYHFLNLDRQMDRTAPDLDLEFVQEITKCFTDYFFLGALGASHGNGQGMRYNVKLRGHWGLQGLTTARSQCLDHQQIRSVLISIDPAKKSSRNPQARRLQILGTVLHELSHAVMMVYGCNFQITRADHVQDFGVRGHGRCFQELMAAVCEVSRNKFYIDLDPNDVYKKDSNVDDYALGLVLAAQHPRLNSTFCNEDANMMFLCGNIPDL